MALLYGQPIAERMLAKTRARIAESGRSPGLAVILVGSDEASHLYVGLKEKAAREIGIRFEKFVFSENAGTEEIFRQIDALNGRPDIHGIIVQLPLPAGFPTDILIARLDPRKDTDGFHQQTLAAFFAGDARACPVFPRAIVELLRATRQDFHGENGLVLANSELLGRVMVQALTLEGLDAEYVVIDTKTRQTLSKKTKRARVIVSACGIPRLLTGEMLAPGAIIIDGGISKENDKVVGDVERESVESVAAFLSPVPGGVGPVTVASLLVRVTDAAL